MPISPNVSSYGRELPIDMIWSNACRRLTRACDTPPAMATNERGMPHQAGNRLKTDVMPSQATHVFTVLSPCLSQLVSCGVMGCTAI